MNKFLVTLNLQFATFNLACWSTINIVSLNYLIQPFYFLIFLKHLVYFFPILFSIFVIMNTFLIDIFK
jgi:hypothetical protein